MPVRAGNLASALLLVLGGCGLKDTESTRLTVTVAGTPWPGGLASRMEAEATKSTLIARDSSGAIVPGLASSWRFVDGDRSLILRLRPTKWDDGTPLAANQVVAAFRRAASRREPALIHAGIANAAGIANGTVVATKLGIRAPISRVVELRLANAAPHLLGWLSEPGLAVVRGAKRPDLGAYIASGPVADRLLKRRSEIAEAASQLPEIALVSVADPAAAVTRFARGESDLVVGDGLSGLGEARIVARPQTLQIEALWGVYGYIANTRSGRLADPRLRRALVLAADRDALRRRIGLAAMAPVTGLLPPALTAFPSLPAGADFATGRAQALALLAEVRGSTEAPIRLKLLVLPGRDHRAIAERVAIDWQPLGIELVISEADPAGIAAAVRRGDFDLALTEASVAVADPAALLARWRCDAGLVCNAAADALLAKALVAPIAERPGLLAAAEAKWLEAPPMVPLLTPLRWALVSRRVDGWVPNPAGVHPLGRLQLTQRRGN